MRRLPQAGRGHPARLDRPRASRRRACFLAAPLAKTAAGKRQVPRAVYKDQSDPDYRAVRELVESAVRKAWEFPRRDVKSLEPKPAVAAR